MDVQAEWHKPESRKVSTAAHVAVIAVEDVHAAQDRPGAETDEREAMADPLRDLSHQTGLLEPVSEHEGVATRDVEKSDLIEHPQDRSAIHRHGIKKLDCRDL